MDDKINSILQNPIPGTDQSLLKDLIQFTGINYHFYEAIQRNETEIIESMIKIMYDFIPKCVESIVTDEYHCIFDNNKQTYNWSLQDFIYFDSFAKDTVKVWDEMVDLLRSRSDFMIYTNKNETTKNLTKLLGIPKTNSSLPLQDSLDWKTVRQLERKVEISK